MRNRPQALVAQQAAQARQRMLYDLLFRSLPGNLQGLVTLKQPHAPVRRELIQKTILGSLNRAKETIERSETAGVVSWRLCW